MKINIGAGDVKYEDYVTIDHDELSNPDYVIDLEKENLPFQDSTVEAVVAHHILEHLGEGYFNCMQELYRVCKHGAIIDIKVPHPNHDTFLSDPTHRRPITVMGLRLFSKKFNALCKEQGYPSSRLGEYYKVDFEILNSTYIPEEGAKQTISSLDEEQLNLYAEQHNNIISEIHIKLVVIKNEQ
jgi:predicted SAM-dependent methyltransferase